MNFLSTRSPITCQWPIQATPNPSSCISGWNRYDQLWYGPSGVFATLKTSWFKVRTICTRGFAADFRIWAAKPCFALCCTHLGSVNLGSLQQKNHWWWFVTVFDPQKQLISLFANLFAFDFRYLQIKDPSLSLFAFFECRTFRRAARSFGKCLETSLPA